MHTLEGFIVNVTKPKLFSRRNDILVLKYYDCFSLEIHWFLRFIVVITTQALVLIRGHLSVYPK